MRLVLNIVLAAALAGIALSAAASTAPAPTPSASKPAPAPASSKPAPAPAPNSSAPAPAPPASSHAPAPTPTPTPKPNTTTTTTTTTTTPKPTPPPPPPIVETALALQNATTNETCILVNFKKLDLTFNGTKAQTIDSNTAVTTVTGGSCGTAVGNTSVTASLKATSQMINQTVQVEFTMFFSGSLATMLGAEFNISSWFLSRMDAQWINGTTTLSNSFTYEQSNSSLKASRGGDVNCSSSTLTSSKVANSDFSFAGLIVQPFNVKNNTFTPSSGGAEACPVESSNKDHTLAIAIAAAVGGLVVVAGLIYLCRRPGRSSYEELSKA